MVTLHDLDHDDLVGSFGSSTFDRARPYADAGRVTELTVYDDDERLVMLGARVLGTRSYSTTVTIGVSSYGSWIDSRCTCPVGRMCKHAAAVVILAQTQAGGGPAWATRLDSVLAELDEAAAKAAASSEVELALEFEVPTRRSRYGAGTHSPTALGVRVRPKRRGARGDWIKTGARWSDVEVIASAEAELISDLAASHRMAQGQLWRTEDEFLTLGSFGPEVWALLARAAAGGIPFLTGGQLASVEVIEDRVRVEVDINGSQGADLHLGLGVRLAGEWYAAGRLGVVGHPGHGVCLWDSLEPPFAVRLAPLSGSLGPQTQRLLAEAATIDVPAADITELVDDVLPRLQRHFPVSSSDAALVVPDRALPRLVLTVEWKAADDVQIIWWFSYLRGEHDRRYALDEARGRTGSRDDVAERALVGGLKLDTHQVLGFYGSTRTDHGLLARQRLQGAAVIAFVEQALLPLEDSGQVVIEESGLRPEFTELHEAPVIRFTPRDAEGVLEAVSAPTDWLDLEVVITVAGHALGLAQLLEAITIGADRVMLHSGLHVRIDRPEFAELRELIEAARELVDQPDDGVTVSRHDLGLWAELADIGLVDAQASSWVRSARALGDLVELPAEEPEVRAELRAYQLDGFRWLAYLWSTGLGGILADDMGLGKTLQTLALIRHARARHAAPFLVVAPTSVVATWAGEAARFTPDLDVRIITESQSRRGRSLTDTVAGADLVITSYTLYRLEVESYLALEWGGLILDEAQVVKNHQGKTYQAIRRLEAPFRLALSGTPMENRLMELWSLLSIVAPGLYPYPDRFRRAVADPVEKEGDAAVLSRFRRRIRPFVLRRTKEAVASDLPPKQEQVLDVVLSPRHRKIYQTHLQRERQSVLGLLGDFDRQRVAIFGSLTRLRQLSLDPGLIDAEYDAIGSAKLDVLVDHLTEILAEGHRALVFSQFTAFLARARTRLDAEGITSSYLDGRTRRRSEVVSAFKAGEGSVFLISLKAGGVGLTLTEADYVFVLDPWWNPAVEAQAVDRAHRIGQVNPVMVYRMVSSETIEEKVMALKERKAALFASVMEGAGGAGAPLSAQDVRELFSDS